MKFSRRGDADGFWVAIICIASAFIVGGTIFYNVGHEQGVRDGIAGKYVVVQLPDRTSVVVEVKNTTAPKAN